jgi:DNA-directed RNA polymerase specialized sigma24 family protein
MHGKKLRTLTPEAFARLLDCLDAEPDQAAVKYEQARQSLITFFAFRNLSDPAALADETLNRVAYRLSEGQEILTGNPLYYFYAVARNVWREMMAKPHLAVPFSEVFSTSAERVPSVEELRTEFADRLAEERRLACLEQCLNQLSEEDRAIVREYHHGQGQTKINQRQALAKRLGITIGGLRNRACRIRDRMADCIRACSGKNLKKDDDVLPNCSFLE